MDRRVFRRKGWLGVVLSLVLCLALVFSVAPPMAAEEAEEGCDSCQAYPIMRPDMETLWEWIEAYNDAPRAEMEREGFEAADFGASKDLLSHLDYTASERNQGNCGNCWAWAGTGCLGIALDVQEGTKDRLSVQYVNSCKSTGNYACCGGTLEDFTDFYDPPGGKGMCLPWGNTEADWHDISKNCASGSSDVACGSIFTDPNYPITSIEAQVVATVPPDVTSDAEAIANIKTMLNQNKAVWFGFRLPDDPAWTGTNGFITFWNNGSEGDVYDMDQFCGDSWVIGQGGGHAILCVGYYDDGGSNRYWLLLNSWGTTSNRSHGLFRIDMDMDYDCTYTYGTQQVPAFECWVLDVTFWSVPDITVDPTSFGKTLPPDTTHNYTLTIGNDGTADLTYDIADYETTGFTAPRGVEAPELTQDKEEGPIELIKLSPSEPMSFAVPPFLGDGVQEEIAYDDGGADNAFSFYDAGGMFAVRFTPSSYPVALQTARICLWPEWPDSDHEQFAVKVYDDGGAGGEPGICLGSVPDTASAWGWWDVDISGLGITITGGDFYIAYEQLTDSPDCEGLCADTTAPDERSWVWDGLLWWQVEDSIGPGPEPLDWMIRCVVEKPDCAWLSESPTSGTVAPAGLEEITLTIDTTGLAAGDYNADILISSNDPGEPEAIVPVTLHVSEGATSCDITLAQGWNLVSLPLIPDSTAITDIISAANLASGDVGNVVLVYYYDASSESWLWYDGSPWGSLPTMEDGLGYWIFVNSADTLIVHGSETPPPAYGVIPKWNMIGFTSTVDMAHETYLVSIAGKYSFLYGYEGGAEGWFYVVPLGDHDGKMEPGHGYWIWMNDGGTIVPP